MKRNLLNFAVVSFIAITGSSFIACSSDDDDEVSANGNPNAGIVETETGAKYRVVQAGNLNYEYDSNGKLVSFADKYDEINVTYNPLKFVSNDNYSSSVISNISLNGNGYITGMKENYSHVYEKDSEKGESTIGISYDGKGHVTRINCSTSAVEIYDGEKESYKSYVDIVYTWNGDKLVKIVETETEDGDKYVTTYEFVYGSNAVENVSCQYVPNILILDDDNMFVNALACIGYLGKGPSVLPTGCNYSYVEDNHKKSGTGTYSYVLQSNGLVSKYIFKSNYGINETGYMEYVSIDSKSSKSAKHVGVAKNAERKYRLFGKIHRKTRK